jgi:hypothetical protein
VDEQGAEAFTGPVQAVSSPEKIQIVFEILKEDQ